MSTYAVFDSIRVHIDPQDEPFNPETDLSVKFLKWLCEPEQMTRVWSFRGGSSGRGHYIADFPAQFKDEILNWFRTNQVPKTEFYKDSDQDLDLNELNQ